MLSGVKENPDSQMSDSNKILDEPKIIRRQKDCDLT